jgi:hypothetical protein
VSGEAVRDKAGTGVRRVQDLGRGVGLPAAIVDRDRVHRHVHLEQRVTRHVFERDLQIDGGVETRGEVRPGAVVFGVSGDVERRVGPERSRRVDRGGRAHQERVLVPVTEHAAADVEELMAPSDHPRAEVIPDEHSDRVTPLGSGTLHGVQRRPVGVDDVKVQVVDLELQIRIAPALVVRLGPVQVSGTARERERHAVRQGRSLRRQLILRIVDRSPVWV